MPQTPSLSDTARSDRSRYDLANFFYVLVGKAPGPQQRFPVHHDVLTSHSEFFRAARSACWLQDPEKPVDLTDVDPELFSLYLNCVYFGARAVRAEPLETLMKQEDASTKSKEIADTEKEMTLRQQSSMDIFDRPEKDCATAWKATDNWETSEKNIQAHKQNDRLLKVYFFAERLQDLKTTNTIMDELVRLGEVARINPGFRLVRSIYAATRHGNPLRRLVRDNYVQDSFSAHHLGLHVEVLPSDFYRDMAVEFLRLRGDRSTKAVQDVYRIGAIEHNCTRDRCHYHQHDDKHPRSVPKPVLHTGNKV